jgi:hypothetical protein
MFEIPVTTSEIYQTTSNGQHVPYHTNISVMKFILERFAVQMFGLI